MKNQLQKLALAAFLLTSTALSAQTLTEKTGIRFYEHHSSDMTNVPFGNSANGSKSGYDFVTQGYYNSFNAATMGPYTNGEEANIDMVEHNGVFGAGSPSEFLGFTSGVSSIWDGDIKGNGTTKWIKVASALDYSQVTDVKALSDAYAAGTPAVAVAGVRLNDVYIGRIRGGDQYVVIKCTAVQVPQGSQGDLTNSYFDFDYKTGTLATGLSEINRLAFNVFPNPASHMIGYTLSEPTSITSVKIYDIKGADVSSSVIADQTVVDVSSLVNGLYLIQLTAADGGVSTRRFMKHN